MTTDTIMDVQQHDSDLPFFDDDDDDVDKVDEIDMYDEVDETDDELDEIELHIVHQNILQCDVHD